GRGGSRPALRPGLSGGLRAAGQRRFQPVLDLAARGRADFLGDRLAALEQEHGRDPADAVAAGRVGILVDVELGYRDLVAELVRNLFERRGDDPAWPAPFGPEIDQHR